MTTIYKALSIRANGPNGGLPFLGTKKGSDYEWMSVKETLEEAKLLAQGMMHLDLLPTIEAEGTQYRFLGIQAKNRKEWNLLHVANMCVGATTVALYDTLGVQASRFVIDQTEMTTIAASVDLVPKIIEMVEADRNGTE